MITYTQKSMVKANHIVEINKQLMKLNSKVEDSLLSDNEPHVLTSVLHLACGGGTYGVSKDDIKNIKTDEFEIKYECENSITRKYVNKDLK